MTPSRAALARRPRCRRRHESSASPNVKEAKAEPTQAPRRTSVTERRIGRPARLVAAAVLTSAMLDLASVVPANAQCVGPSLGVQHQLRPGGTVTIIGRNFFSKCSDIIVVGGCGGPEKPTGPSDPMKSVQLTIRQHREAFLLGRRDANKRFRIALPTTLPVQLRPGRAILQGTITGFTVTTRHVVVHADHTGTASTHRCPWSLGALGDCSSPSAGAEGPLRIRSIATPPGGLKGARKLSARAHYARASETTWPETLDPSQRPDRTSFGRGPGEWLPARPGRWLRPPVCAGRLESEMSRESSEPRRRASEYS
jgi:hypothetical protein